MAIQVRRGNESDFDASKMLPGEWAVSLDTKYVRMCFAPGVVLRMATYEAFEADKAQIQSILAECRTIESAIRRIQAEVNSKASLTVEYANSAKESADRAYTEAERAKIYADNAEAVTGVNIATQDRAGIVKGGDNYIAEDGTLELIKETTSTTLPNSHAGRFKFDKIGGKMEQDNTTGKNLLDSSGLTATTTNGITYTPVYAENGTLEYINANGTATGEATYRLDSAFMADDEFILSGCAVGGTKDTYYIACGGIGFDVGDGLNIPNDNVTHFVGIGIKAGTTVTNARFYPMIRLASVTDATYEPYTGGQPAPNPSYPMEIKKTVVSEIRTYFAKGLVNPYTCVNGLLNTSGVLTTASTWVTSDYSEVKGGTKISISTKTKVVRFAQYDANKNFIKNTSNIIGVTDSTYIPWTTTLESNTKYVRATFGLETSITPHELFKNHWIQIEEGEPTEFELLKESSATLSQPIDLYGKDGVQDVITAKEIGGKWTKLHLNANDVVQVTYYEATNTNRFAIDTSNLPSIGIANRLMCNIAKTTNGGADTNTCRIYSNIQIFLFLDADEFPDKASLETYLETNEVYFVYQLAKETAEALPIADQIALNSLATYDGVTYVEFIYEGPQPTFKGEYGTSKVGGYTLESLLVARNNDLRITAVESAVVNNL